MAFSATLFLPGGTEKAFWLQLSKNQNTQNVGTEFIKQARSVTVKTIQGINRQYTETYWEHFEDSTKTMPQNRV
jgi:hypothetical protein